MKQIGILISAILLTYNLAIAQDTMYVHQNGGVITKIAVSKIDSVTFIQSQNTAIFVIGQSYQGGIIAYIDGTGLHGLIAAPNDQSSSAKWGCYSSGTTISGADGMAIGTGAQNTLDILAGCSEAGIAARLCDNLVLGGYSDWYLPSPDELNQLYINRIAIGGFTSNVYWASCDNTGTPTAAFIQDFNTGSSFGNYKIVQNSVRAVRSF